MVRCDLCGRFEDRDRAIEAGWAPYYWVTQYVCREEPVCPDCAGAHLEELDEEPVLKEGHLIALGGD